MPRHPGFPILLLTLGWFGIYMAMALDATQFQIMLDSRLHNARAIGWVLSLGPAAGILIQPLIGWFGDHWQRQGLDRRRIMAISLLASFGATLWLSGHLSTVGMIVLMGIFYAAFNVLMVTYRALVTDVSGRRFLASHKGLISGYVGLFSGAGSFSMFALCSGLGTSPYPFWIGGAVLLITFILFFCYAPKAKTSLQSQNTEILPDKSLFSPWNLLVYALPPLIYLPAIQRRVIRFPEQHAIFRLFTVLFFSWIGIQALRGYFVLFGTKALHLSFEWSNGLLAILTLVMVGAALPLGKLADRLENRTLYRWALIFFGTVAFGAYALVHQMASAALMSVLLGISFAGMVVFPLSLLLKLCPKQHEGAYAGLYNLFLSVPQLYSLLITGHLITLFNDYRVILPVAGVAVFLAVLATFGMPTTPTRHPSAA